MFYYSPNLFEQIKRHQQQKKTTTKFETLNQQQRTMNSKFEQLQIRHSKEKTVGLMLGQSSPVKTMMHIKKKTVDKSHQRLESLSKRQGNKQKGKVKFFVFNGNNSELVVSVLGRREYLQQSISPFMSQIVWKPFSNFSDFDSFSGSVFNHIEGHAYLTRKELIYCKLKQIDSTHFLPQTFIINTNSDLLKGYNKFLAALSNPNTYWLFKPPDLNRGCGIRIIKDLDGLKKCIEEYQLAKTKYGVAERSKKPNEKKKQDDEQCTESRTNLGYVVVQEYIHNPLLIHSRKFDIRMWMLVDHNRCYYYYKEGYIRLSGIEYKLDDHTIANLYIHLTNNAIQKNHSSYGSVERGNQMSFTQFQDYLNAQNVDGRQLINSLLKKVRDIMHLAVRSVRNKLNVYNKQWQFELMGLDFMVDTNYQVWLIEVNTNPCLELSSPLLQALIPRMLNDLFRITVDEVFKMDNAKNLGAYKLEGYSNDENLFQYLGTV